MILPYSCNKLLYIIGFFCLVNTAAYANWNGFYTSKKITTIQRTSTQATSPIQSVCVREILLAQDRHDIPDNILLGIGLQEAGTRRNKELVVWPWAVNAEGRGKLFDTKGSAMQWVYQQLQSGMRSIDIGCMQINLRWHPDAFSSLEDGFNPKINVDYAARLLKNHYYTTGSWRIAAGRYHSKTPDKQATYLKSLQRNIRVANAQVDQFRRLAALKSTVTKITKNPADQPYEHVTVATQSSRFWTSALSQSVESSGRYRSIYSANDLQPILPNFNTSPDGE